MSNLVHASVAAQWPDMQLALLLLARTAVPFPDIDTATAAATATELPQAWQLLKHSC